MSDAAFVLIVHQQHPYWPSECLKYTLKHTNQLSPYTTVFVTRYALLAAYMILVQAHTVYKYKWWPFITYTCRSAMGAPKL